LEAEPRGSGGGVRGVVGWQISGGHGGGVVATTNSECRMSLGMTRRGRGGRVRGEEEAKVETIRDGGTRGAKD
jgi:hypothetical protein